jgi:hypothetical protein
MRRARLAAAAFALGALSVAGCGGGNGGLSSEELIAQADAICVEYERRTEGVATPEGFEDIERFAAETRTLIQEAVNELAGLKPPEELAEDYDRWIAQNEENLGLLEEVESAAAEGDEPRVRDLLGEAQQAGARTDRLAREIGFEECGTLD